MLHLQSSGQYLTVSKGGNVGLRDAEDVSLLRTHRLQNGTVAPKHLWVTDAVLLQNVEKVKPVDMLRNARLNESAPLIDLLLHRGS